MSTPQPPQPAKLVIGVFMKNKSLLAPIAEELSKCFGAVDMMSRWLPFDYTSYYEAEMGNPLFRRVLTFKTLIEQEQLPQIKLATNAIEQRYSADKRREVNIDPGYMLHERFVLATGKNYTHRIYIGHRVYADLTLIYQKGDFRTLPWTYPDYADERMLVFLRQVRNKYTMDIKGAMFSDD